MSELFGTLSLDTSAYFEYNNSIQTFSSSLENTSIANVRLGAIKGIRVRNFKSFEDEHYIGPFTRFTCVIGPNGGGKSNVLDAIQFLMGMSIRSMRCRAIEELVYTRNQHSQKDDREAVVEVLFEALHYVDNQIVLKRTLSLSGQTCAYVGDVPLTEKEFGRFLLMSRVIVPARNFTMLQGETDFLATIEPKKLTELFEIVSGSVQYKQICLQIQGELNHLVQKMRDLQLQKGQLRSEQRKLKELRQTGDSYRKLLEEINELKLKQKLVELKRLDDQILEAQKSLEAQRSQDSNSYDQQLAQEIHESEQALAGFKSELRRIEETNQQFKRLEGSKHFDSSQIEVEIQLLKKQIEALRTSNSRLKKDQAVQMELVSEVELDVKQKEREIEKLKSAAQLELPQKSMEEFQELQAKFKAQYAAQQSEIQKLQQKTGMYAKIMDQIEDEQNKLKSSLQELAQDRNDIQASENFVQSELNAQDDRFKNLMTRLQELERQNAIEQNEIKQLTALKNQKESDLHLLDVMETEHIDERQTQLLIQQLKSMFRDFHGELSQLCYPEHQNHAIALKVALGQRLLCALVVDSEESTKSINKHLKSLEIVKELIVLDRIRRVPDDATLRERIAQFVLSMRQTNRNAKAHLAIDLLVHEDRFAGALAHVLQGVIVCDSYQVAVALQRLNLPEVKQIVTFDGISLSQGGMIVFNGTAQRLSGLRNFSQNNQRANHKKESREQLLKSIETTKDKLRSLKQNSVVEELKSSCAQKAKLESQKVELLAKQRSNKQRLEEVRRKEEQIERQLSDLKAEWRDRDAVMKEIEHRLKELNGDLQRQLKTAFREFGKKHKLNDEQLYSIDQQTNISSLLEQKQQQLLKLVVQKTSMDNEISTFNRRVTEIHDEIHKKEDQIKEYEQRMIDLKNNYARSSENVKELSSKEVEINSKIKTEQKRLKSLLEAREKNMKRKIESRQTANFAQRRIEQLQYNKMSVIELCEIESIPVRRYPSTQFQPSYNFDEEDLKSYEINYDPLDNKTPDNRYEMQIERTLKEKEQDIAKYLSENLQVGLVGGKTDERFFSIEKQIEVLTSQIRVLTTRESELTESLAKTRAQRKQRFEQLFERVERDLKTFYARLTENQNRLGGSVILYVENKEEPFEGGIIYTPNPPNKKYIFDNSEQLSGGEKTVASVAMLLAINAAIETPFILFDEVDAHLDPENAEKLKSIVKTLASQIQFVMVSHNPEVFSAAESLIGVTIQFQKATSEAFSLYLA